jgi:hypothetical protein
MRTGVIRAKRAGPVRRTKLMTAALIASIGVLPAFSVPPGTAEADPSDEPCGLAVAILCRFAPIAPGLDEDLDLTKQQPPADRADLRPGEPPLADICTSGCI